MPAPSPMVGLLPLHALPLEAPRRYPTNAPRFGVKDAKDTVRTLVSPHNKAVTSKATADQDKAGAPSRKKTKGAVVALFSGYKAYFVFSTKPRMVRKLRMRSEPAPASRCQGTLKALQDELAKTGHLLNNNRERYLRPEEVSARLTQVQNSINEYENRMAQYGLRYSNGTGRP